MSDQAPNTPAVLRADSIHAGYGEAEILHAVDFEVDRDEIVTVIGPNGAGKSTLLKAVMGYLIPTQGRVLFRGEDVTRLRPDQRARVGIAYVPQLEHTFTSLNVEENLRMGGYTLDRDTMSRRIQEQYERFPRLAERRKQRVRTMSGGERQQLAMARALMTDPQVVLLDEPSAALSPKLAGQVFDQVEKIHAEGIAIGIVEQDAQRSLQISDRGYVLVDGQNAFTERADRILENEEIRRLYLGTAEEA